MPEELNLEELYGQYGGQHAPQDYISAVEAAGYEAQLISGKAPTLESSQYDVLADITDGGAGGIYKIKSGDLEQQSYAERSALGATGTANQTYAYWDEGRGVTVHAKPGYHFEQYSGGGVRLVKGLIAKGVTATQAEQGTRSSLFDQPADLQAPGTYEGKEFKQEQLAYQPIEGKEIETTGQTVFNPKTGVDEYANPGEVLIKYKDGTVERRKIGGAPGESVPVDQFGRTSEELGITRQTEIKGEDGQITQAPQSAKQVLDQMIAEGKSPEEIDQFLQSEGQTSTADFELIGKTYQGKTADEGFVFYQKKGEGIVQRPEALQSLAKPSTSPTVAAERADIPTLFQAVFGRQPTAEELKYWQGRTDKTGGALVGAMQTARLRGLSTGEAGAKVPDDPVEAMKMGANTTQEKLASFYQEQGITSKSSDLKRLRADIEATKEPAGQSQLEFTKEQLASSQMLEASDALNQAKDALRKLDAGHLSNIESAERVPGLSMGAIRRNLGELDIAYNRARRDLVAEVEARAEIVSSQTAIMGLMIDAFQSDRAAAQVDYTNRINKATALYNMTAQEQQFEYSVQQDYINSQRANLSVISGLLSEGRISYDNLSTEDKARISTMEQAVGLSGISQAISRTPLPPVVSIGSPITDASGVNHIPIYSQNPATGEVSISYFDTPFKERIPGGGGSESGDILSGILSGILGQDSEYEIVTDDILDPPPMSGVPGTHMEWPGGSGNVWVANKQGVWE